VLLRASAIQVLAALLQASVLPGLMGVGIRPELPIVVTVAWAALRGWEDGLWIGAIGGLVTDLLSAAPFGLNILRLAIVGLAAGVVMERIARSSPMVPVIAAGAGSLVAFVIGVLGLQAAGRAVPWEHSLATLAFPNAALTALCMAAVVPILHHLQQREMEREAIVPDMDG
jgi:rod shape-determining protein MreD